MPYHMALAWLPQDTCFILIFHTHDCRQPIDAAADSALLIAMLMLIRRFSRRHILPSLRLLIRYAAGYAAAAILLRYFITTTDVFTTDHVTE